MSSLARHVETCLAALGTDRFAPAFCDFALTLGADQIMVFAVTRDRARCLLSRHFRRAALAGRLAADYLDGWYLRDPLLPELLAAPPGTLALRRLDEGGRDMDAEYRARFFDRPGLIAKTTLLAVGERSRLFVSLYAADRPTESCPPDLARLAGRLALMHFDREEDPDAPPPLAALSARESAVCRGILAGRKTELIAADLSVAPSTVVTYRKRAYAKLGVTSRAGLFAVCRR